MGFHVCTFGILILSCRAVCFHQVSFALWLLSHWMILSHEKTLYWFISVWSHVLLDTKSCTPAPYWGVELERSPQCSICVAAISYVMRLSAALTSYLIGRLRIRKPYTKFQFSPAIYRYLFEIILSCSFHVKIHNSQSWWFKCNIHIGNR